MVSEGIKQSRRAKFAQRASWGFFLERNRPRTPAKNFCCVGVIQQRAVWPGSNKQESFVGRPGTAAAARRRPTDEARNLPNRTAAVGPASCRLDGVGIVE